MPKTFSLVLARTHKGGIGLNGGLPWKLKTDLQHFKKITTQGSKNVIIMGRKTFESLKNRPLPLRENVVISKTLKPSQKDFLIFPSIDEALNYYDGTSAKVHVIGGKGLFEQSLENTNCTEIHLTRVGREVPCDVYFDNKLNDYDVTQTSKTYSENNINFDFQHLLRKGCKVQDKSFIETTSEEFQYLDLIRTILDQGTKKDDRTGVGTVSIFGQTMRYSLNESFPLLTTKKTFFRGVIEELLWFIKGDTNGHHLLDKQVKIWEGNGTRQYLDSIGINREEHDLGPIYGFQWRHFGAKYSDFNQNYEGQGVDQLKQLIHMIKTQPDSRRLILSAWNPVDIPQMALPPCHVMAQFYVANGKLSCMMYQRSCDFGLGVPFNIASYALLTCMIAQVCNLERGDFIHVLGDTHIYSNHVDQLQSQIKRVPYPFPLLNIAPKTNIEDFTVDDFELIGYKSHDKIQMKMAV